jgi:hypothetical protein
MTDEDRKAAQIGLDLLKRLVDVIESQVAVNKRTPRTDRVLMDAKTVIHRGERALNHGD